MDVSARFTMGAWTALVVLAARGAAGQAPPPSPPPPDEPPAEAPAEEQAPEAQAGLRLSAAAGIQHVFKTDVGGADFDLTRLGARLGAEVPLDERLTLRLAATYLFDDYEFDGVSDLGADPWDDVQTLVLAGRLRWRVNRRWSVFGGPLLSSSRESGAAFEDSLTGGGVLGATYAFSRQLIVGGGFGVTSQLEDDARAFPLVFVEWRIDDRSRITTRGGPIGPGTGLEYVYDIGGGWETGVGARYEFRRFRLDGSGTAPDGVGEHEGLLLWGRLSYRLDASLSADLFAGVMLGGEMTLENDDGGRIGREDHDPAPAVALNVRVRF